MDFSLKSFSVRARMVSESVTLAVLRSISISPLKLAPSSIMMRPVVSSPATEPSFLISIRSCARSFGNALRRTSKFVRLA